MCTNMYVTEVRSLLSQEKTRENIRLITLKTSVAVHQLKVTTGGMGQKTAPSLTSCPGRQTKPPALRFPGSPILWAAFCTCEPGHRSQDTDRRRKLVSSMSPSSHEAWRGFKPPALSGQTAALLNFGIIS